MNKIERSLFVCFIALSVIIRVPNLNRPVSKHHEFNTAFFLIPMEIWNKSSIRDYAFSPVMNYPNPADQNINNFSDLDCSKDGSYYYLSFGPMSYILPYTMFRLFGLEPSPFALQVFSMLVHVLCAFLIFKITVLLTREEYKDKKTNLAALVASGAYFFACETLWFHGNGYTHHSLVILFFLWTLYLALRIFMQESKKPFWTHTALFLAVFLTIYTEWLGCFLAFVLFFTALLSGWKKYKTMMIVCILASVSALALIFWQYSSIIGGEKFIAYLTDRFWVRSYLDNGVRVNSNFIAATAKWYLYGFLPLIILLLVLRFSQWKMKFQRQQKKFLLLAVIPVFMHHFVFSEFTVAHDYSALADAVYLSVLSGLFVSKLSWTSTKKTAFISLLSLICLLSFTQYYYINRPGEFGQNGDRYDAVKNIGETIKRNSYLKEVIFIQDLKDYPNPQVIYYMKRNYVKVKSLQEAMLHLQTGEIKTGYFVRIKNDRIAELKHLEI